MSVFPICDTYKDRILTQLRVLWRETVFRTKASRILLAITIAGIIIVTYHHAVKAFPHFFAFLWCFFYSPLGMAMLRSMHYSSRAVACSGTILGCCGATLYWATTYYDFSRFSCYKKMTEFIARYFTRATDFIHRYVPVFTIRKSPPVFSRSKPYLAILIAAISDIWLALIIARKHPDVNHWIILSILLAVSALKNVLWHYFIAFVASTHPFIANHITAITALAAIVALIFSECWARWRARRYFIRPPEPLLELDP